MQGRIHSTESCGTVDGPGIRFVVFMQGCPMRCRYCHNPDTWNTQGGNEISVDAIMQELEGYETYMKFSGGGITVTGGEPLLQAAFVKELFTRCKARGIHTCLDTSGIVYGAEAQRPIIEELLDVTDLVLLDIKHIDEEKHKKLTRQSNTGIVKFAERLAERSIPVWVRHVLVPGYTDNEADLQRLADFLKTLSNIKKIEVLPYHCMGVYKWQALGLEYELEGILPPSAEKVQRAVDILESAIVIHN